MNIENYILFVLLTDLKFFSR